MWNIFKNSVKNTNTVESIKKHKDEMREYLQDIAKKMSEQSKITIVSEKVEVNV